MRDGRWPGRLLLAALARCGGGSVEIASPAAADDNVSGIFAARAGGGVFDAPPPVSDPAVPADYDKPWAVRLADGSRLVTYQGRAADGTVLAVAARSADGSAWTRASIADD